MAIDEARRHELHETARRVLGAEAGDTLMALIPPVGWAEVATKHDVDRALQMLAVELRATVVDTVRGAEHRILMWMFTTVLTAVLAGIAISVTVALSV